MKNLHISLFVALLLITASHAGDKTIRVSVALASVFEKTAQYKPGEVNCSRLIMPAMEGTWFDSVTAVKVVTAFLNAGCDRIISMRTYALKDGRYKQSTSFSVKTGTRENEANGDMVTTLASVFFHNMDASNAYDSVDQGELHFESVEELVGKALESDRNSIQIIMLPSDDDALPYFAPMKKYFMWLADDIRQRIANSKLGEIEWRIQFIEQILRFESKQQHILTKMGIISNKEYELVLEHFNK